MRSSSRDQVGQPAPPSRVLLIVDDTPEVARGLERNLLRDFDAVHVALSPASAERILEAERLAPTHIICDFFFANDGRRGTELVPAWRRKYSGIVVAVILSGSQIEDLEPVPGVDGIYKKPTEIDLLMEFLTRPRAYEVA